MLTLSKYYWMLLENVFLENLKNIHSNIPILSLSDPVGSVQICSFLSSRSSQRLDMKNNECNLAAQYSSL